MKSANKKQTRSDLPDVEDIGKRIVAVGTIQGYWKVVLYGKSGSGKTTFASSFPGPILLADAKDEGTDSVSDVKGLKVLPMENWHDFEHLYWYLKKNSKLYKTCIIDTVTMLQDFAIKVVLAEANKDTDEAITWGVMTKREWGQVATLLKTWITNFRDLPMNIVFIAQDRTFNAGDEEDDSGLSPEVGPRIMPSVASTLNAAVDVIGNTFIREKWAEEKKEGKKIKKRKVEYCLRIGPHATYTTKIRKPKSVEVPAVIANPTFDKLLAIREGD